MGEGSQGTRGLEAKSDATQLSRTSKIILKGHTMSARRDTPLYWSAAGEPPLAPNLHDAQYIARQRRFYAEPPAESPSILGETIYIPKYNGVNWWFPISQVDGPPLERQLEAAFHSFFTSVSMIQTTSIFLWTCILVYWFGYFETLSAIPVTIALESQFKQRYGDNYGTAYFSMNALYIGFHFNRWWSGDRTGTLSNSLGLFAPIFCIAHILANTEKRIMGWTWYAAFMAYGHLVVWIYDFVSLVMHYYKTGVLFTAGVT